MPPELIQSGQRVFDGLGQANKSNHLQLIARCLVGFGNALQGIRLDPASAHHLKEWLEFGNDALQVEIQALPGGLRRIRLVSNVDISASVEKLFLLVLAVNWLSVHDIETLVQPYRTIKSLTPKNDDQPP
jgi:hypothetical protein